MSEGSRRYSRRLSKAESELWSSVTADVRPIQRRAAQDRFVGLGERTLARIGEVVPRAFEYGDFEGSNRASRLREQLLEAHALSLRWLIGLGGHNVAEMTEAFFGTNDFAPFNRAELKTGFPDLHALLEEIWGPDRAGGDR